MGLALLVDGDLYLVLIGRNLFLCLFEVWIVAVGTWLHLVEVELYVGGIGTAAVLVGHFLDLDGLACHIVVLLLLGQFLLEIGVESADGPVLIEPVVGILLLLLTARITFCLLLLLVSGLLLVSILFLTLRLSCAARHELHTTLFHIHLQQRCKLAPVGKLNLLAKRNT